MTERSSKSYPRAGQGESVVWAALATMIAGPVLYGLIGLVVNKVADVSFGVPVGISVGFALSASIIYLRYGRD